MCQRCSLSLSLSPYYSEQVAILFRTGPRDSEAWPKDPSVPICLDADSEATCKFHRACNPGGSRPLFGRHTRAFLLGSPTSPRGQERRTNERARGINSKNSSLLKPRRERSVCTATNPHLNPSFPPPPSPPSGVPAVVGPSGSSFLKAAAARAGPQPAMANSLRGGEALLELLGHVLVQLLLVLEDVALPHVHPLVLAQPHLLGNLPRARPSVRAAAATRRAAHNSHTRRLPTS
jgi:hypothetical protein